MKKIVLTIFAVMVCLWVVGLIMWRIYVQILTVSVYRNEKEWIESLGVDKVLLFCPEFAPIKTLLKSMSQTQKTPKRMHYISVVKGYKYYLFIGLFLFIAVCAILEFLGLTD